MIAAVDQSLEHNGRGYFSTRTRQYFNASVVAFDGEMEATTGYRSNIRDLETIAANSQFFDSLRSSAYLTIGAQRETGEREDIAQISIEGYDAVADEFDDACRRL